MGKKAQSETTTELCLSNNDFPVACGSQYVQPVMYQSLTRFLCFWLLNSWPNKRLNWPKHWLNWLNNWLHNWLNWLNDRSSPLFLIQYRSWLRGRKRADAPSARGGAQQRACSATEITRCGHTTTWINLVASTVQHTHLR